MNQKKAIGASTLLFIAVAPPPSSLLPLFFDLLVNAIQLHNPICSAPSSSLARSPNNTFEDSNAKHRFKKSMESSKLLLEILLTERERKIWRYLQN
ncbi:hypothetical protein SOVF_112850 [Spinacia oleracea]|nr:hypothetical protein SOVF_112850 [Spinacia oleracea]